MTRLLRPLGMLVCSTLFTGTLAWEAPAQTDPLQVVTTILPISQFTLAVAGERASVTSLMPTTMGPHGYQARPQDAQALAQADVLVLNGLEIEGFLEGLIENAGNSELVMIDSSEGIATIPTADNHGDHADDKAHDHDHHDHDHHDHADDKAHDHAGDHDHAEDHDHDGDHDHDHDGDHDHDHDGDHDHDHDGDHDHDHDGDHDHDHDEDHDHHADDKAHGHSHSHGEFDPHVWLDPKRAIQQVENIRDGLIAADPEGETVYTENAEAYIEKLEALDADITTQLEPHAGKRFVVFHDFVAYFADSYSLEDRFLVAVPEDNASPDDVRRVMTTVQEAGLQTVLTEPQAGGRSPFEAIAQDLGIQVSVFDPIETGPADALDPDYYLTVMRQNATNLEQAFVAEVALQSNVPQVDPLVAQGQRITP